jgi:hypothetical protein
MNKYECCKGCLIYEGLKDDVCFISQFVRHEECPCVHCLVKVVCDEPCDKFYFIYKHKRSEL